MQTLKLYRAAGMRRADEEATAAGVPTGMLMEAAGRAVADSARSNFPNLWRVMVLCGKGNNGGDGYVAARYLHMAGIAVRVLEFAPAATGDAAGDAATARRALLAHLPTERLTRETLIRELGACDLVIDALFGSGLTRPLTDDHAAVVELINDSQLPVLSVDVPSGVSSDSPTPPGAHIRATRTVQLAGAKLASAFYPARSAFGEQEVADIGIPRPILQAASTVRLLGPEVAAGIPARAREAHKYQVGTVMVLAGSPHYLGAAELACRGAYRAGAGLVTLAAKDRLPSGWPEIIFFHIDWDDDPVDRLSQVSGGRAQAVVAGPGLDERALEHLPDIIAQRAVPWVLDAGALQPKPALRAAVRRHGGCVLTPHAGEAAKLLGVDSSEVTTDPLGASSHIAQEWNAVCVLKGGSTTIASAQSLAVSVEGHSGMASGGTGDVLAGVLGAFLAAPLNAASHTQRVEAAVAVHGRAGKLAGELLGAGMLAGDLIAQLPAALLAFPEGMNI
ncbi:MAG: NAD(P)H-hydrate dehydratase [Trueperaceae bacterium]